MAGGVPQWKDAVGPTPRRYHIADMVSGQARQYLRPRGYAHFDKAPTLSFALEYVSDPQRIAAHAFWPFLRYSKKSPRYDRHPATGKRSFLRVKQRPISYAAHLDSHIYTKYAADLSALLESRYTDPFGRSVLAYRRHYPPRNNAHFAVAAFEEIKSRGDCNVIALDVENFFDSLDHKVLKAAWISLLDSGSPPERPLRSV